MDNAKRLEPHITEEEISTPGPGIDEPAYNEIRAAPGCEDLDDEDCGRIIRSLDTVAAIICENLGTETNEPDPAPGAAVENLNREKEHENGE